MMPSRRDLLIGAAALLAPRPVRGAEPAVEIAMAGRGDGSHVWFDPVGVLVRPGQTVRWTNRETGNVHTATAYHPANFDRPLRIPGAAVPWDSDYLMPGESFAVELTEPGVYDYYCVPHEHAAGGQAIEFVVRALDDSGIEIVEESRFRGPDGTR